MKYSYKQELKKLLMLFYLLSMAFVAVAQVSGTPYGLAALSPATIPTGSGSFAGRTCFDVAQVNDAGECGNLTSRQNETLTANGSRADFGDPITRNQTYTFTPSGTVSNVRFYYEEASRYEQQIIASLSGGNSGNNITSSNPVTCNITYRANLNNRASGKTNANALTVDIYAVYNDNANGTGDDKQLKLTAMIKDCACCGAYTTSGNWLQFMCYNLGADPTLTTPEQIKNASPTQTTGFFYQWGKKKTWPSTGSVEGWSYTENDDVYGPGGNTDANAWGYGTGKGPADPCPNGWKIPSPEQWQSILGIGIFYPPDDRPEVNNWARFEDTETRGFEVGPFMFLPAAGARLYLNGYLITGLGQYNTAAPGTILILQFNSYGVGTPQMDNVKHYGSSVRCVAD